MRFLVSLGFLAFLGACASLTQEQCLSGDWRSIGYNDGVNGRQESYISRHFDACEKVGIVPNTSQWLQGRLQGLPLYCTPQNAYNVGRGGHSLSPVCPASQQNSLYRSWDWGQEYYIISGQIDDLEDDQREIEYRIRTEFNVVPLTPAQILTLSSLSQRLRWINEEIARLAHRRVRYATAPF